MTWDAELEALVNKVDALFGEGAAADAFIRALTRMPTSQRDVNLGDDLTDNFKVVEGRAIVDALRRELNQLLEPH